MSLPGWLAEPAQRLDRMLEGARTPHAVLIDGPGGWGEGLLASHFVLRLLGEERTADARSLAHPDLRWVEPEDATVKIEQVRDLTGFMFQTAVRGATKAAVLEQADRMTVNAANALLKTLEEPPPGSYLVLVTSAPQRLPATVRSRCQRVAVHPAGPDAVAAWLRERSLDSPDVAPLLVELGGAPYRVLEALEREEKPIWDVLQAVAAGRKGALDAAAEWRTADLPELCARWLRHVHRMVRTRPDPRPLLDFAARLTALRAAALANSGLARQTQLERVLLDWRDVSAFA
ncbi:MAG: hypothetical protein F4X99_16195 [Gammaproteobacteria bacterium]|nr:hypothetical protein [Gammaproteobacteria bacterium]